MGSRTCAAGRVTTKGSSYDSIGGIPATQEMIEDHHCDHCRTMLDMFSKSATQCGVAPGCSSSSANGHCLAGVLMSSSRRRSQSSCSLVSCVVNSWSKAWIVGLWERRSSRRAVPMVQRQRQWARCPGGCHRCQQTSLASALCEVQAWLSLR